MAWSHANGLFRAFKGFLGCENMSYDPLQKRRDDLGAMSAADEIGTSRGLAAFYQHVQSS